ncbi:MAG: FtsX-like permease family protein [Xanthomonadales bacterium]
MPVLYRASLGYLLRHPWQLALALLGICIGVAVIVAVDLANESSRKAFALSMDTITGEATHQIIGGPNGVEEKLYARLRVEAGIRSIAPVLEGYVEVNNATIRLLGVDLFAERQMRTFTFDVKSAPAETGLSAEALFSSILTDPGAVLMSQQTADSLGLQAGDTFMVSAGGKTFPASLPGLLGNGKSSALNKLMVVDIAVAQTWLNQFGWLSRIDVRIPTGDSTLQGKLKDLLPPGTQLLNAAGRTRSLTEMSTAFMTNLTAMSLLALLVGIFLIYNSVSFAVLQRRELIGVLRALGVTRQQVFALILTEGAVLGLVGAAMGVMLGIWLGEHLLVLVSRSINDFYFRVSVSEVTVNPYSIGKGLIAGLGATLVAAVVPAAEAASYQPRLALARSVLEHRIGRLLPVIAIAGISMGLLAVLLLYVSGSNLVAGLAAVFMLILGFALCVPLAVRAITSVLEPLAAKLGGTPARLAVSGIGANLSRTGVAIVALAVAVSATIGVSVMVNSFRGSVSAWLDKTLQSDIYLNAPHGTLDHDLIEDLVRAPGVEAYSSTRRVWLENETGRTRIIAVQLAPGGSAGLDILDADPELAWRAVEGAGAVLVSEPYAYHNAVAAGDTIKLLTRFGEQDFLVAATWQSYDVNAGAVLMSRRTYDRFWNDSRIDSIGLYMSPGTNIDDLLQQLTDISAGRQQIFLRSNREIRDLTLQIFDRTFIITDVLYWLATGVALIGILGSMLALQLERGRELAILRALGMTPAQLGSMVTMQSAAIGLLSGLAAVPLGLVMAWVLIEVINRRAFGWQMDIQVSPQVLLTTVLLSVGAALLAGLYPAYRAASSSPAHAMREE